MSHWGAAGRQISVGGRKRWGGQSFVRPSQLSAASQLPATGRQTATLFASAGQVGPLPGQVSAGSQAPAEARHWKVAGRKPSGGQLLFTPSQFSATSH